MGYAGEKWCSRQEFRLQPPRSKRGALYIELQERFREWTRAPDSHRVIRFCRPTVRRLYLARALKVGRPTGAAPARRSSQDRMLAVTSRPPFESHPATGAAPVWSRLQGECMSCSAKPESKWRKLEGMLLILRSAGRSVFETVPARLSGSASVFEIGESPRCCPVLRGLRDRCFAAKLATQMRKSVDMLHNRRLQVRPVSNRRRHARPL